jgi:phosphate transport system substrate-binding protein
MALRHAVFFAAAFVGCQTAAAPTVVAPATTKAAVLPSNPDAPPPTPTAPEAHVLHFHGSNTLGLGPIPKLAKAFLEKQGAPKVYVNEEGRAKERIWVQARLTNPDREISIEVYAPGTKVGFESLSQGYADVVMASRPATDTELKLEPVENVVAMDGIAVVVHPKNPVARLNIKQLAAVYAKENKDWSQVGGAKGPIHVLARDDKSGTTDGFSSLVMRGKPIKADKTFEDNEALIDALNHDENAIGFVGLPYVRDSKVLAIQDGAARPFSPTPFTIATEDYPLSRRLFLYLAPKSTDSLARDFVDFALSDEGQTLVGESGLVPLSVKSENAQSQIPTDAPPTYSKVVTGATRLSVNFRFKSMTGTALDSKSARDLARLARHFGAAVNKGRRVTLVGFSDNQGTEDTAQKLSKTRADAVATAFTAQGVPIAKDDVIGIGSALPIAPNDSKEGRARNRRVEVWIH